METTPTPTWAGYATAACEACGTPVNPVELAMAAQDNYPIHLDCVRRRHKAALRGKCGCRTSKWAKRCKTGSRAWDACTRCGGQIRQVS